ncbi:MAG: UbiD family decarboxylase [Acidaminococcales bacterium]|jgi:2,5-furandicarboxylate decarboxylase 1|nr:UbiD family decarboxylase [Acidaminococcales bacterium]
MDFKGCIEKLAAAGRLARVRSAVDLRYELAGVAKRFEGGKAVVFDKPKGGGFPLAIGIWWNRENLACLFDVEAPRLPFLFSGAVKSLHGSPVAAITVKDAPAQKVVMKNPDLAKLSVPTFALKDGGPYFSSCVVIARDPDTGVRNASVHRLMAAGERRLGILLDVGRHLRDYYERAEAKGRPLDITINNGVHPAYYVAAITPGAAAPIDKDELAVASALLGEPARLCAGKAVAAEGIADAQLIIEGQMLPARREPEGPFGEVTGYYSSRADRWVVEVKAITHAENPLLHSLLPGAEVWNSVGLTAEASIFETVSKQVKGLKAVYLTHGGCGFYHAVIQIDPPLNGMSKNAIIATFAAFPPLQAVTAVNSDVDIADAVEVERALITRCNPAADILVLPNMLGHELNPAIDNGFGAKVGFDCTYPVPKESKFEKIKFMDVKLDDYDIVE